MKTESVLEIAFLVRTIVGLLSFGAAKAVDVMQIVELVRKEDIDDENLAEIITDMVAHQARLKELLKNEKALLSNSPVRD